MTLLRIGDVFVAGGEPTITYVEREAQVLEKRIRDYLALRRKILVVSGPTKSGKTVLLRRVVPRHTCFWIPGGEIESYEDFWSRICRDGEQPVQITEAGSESAGESRTADVDIGVRPYGIGGGFKHASQDTRSVSNTETRTYQRNPTVEGPRLLRQTQRTLVIDDFHYVPEDVRQRIVRALKDLVFDGVAVIFLCIPHRVVDAVRAEPEMNGRVESIEVPPWREEELIAIATLGFQALELAPGPGVVQRLLREAFGSPFLMQELCGALCLSQGLYQQQQRQTPLPAPDSWDRFFRDKAGGFESDAFNRLAQGPRTRTDRIQRPLKHGRGEADLYRAMLIAIAECGGSLELAYEPTLRDALRNVLVELPKVNEVTFVLNKMKEIARQVARKQRSPGKNYGEDEGETESVPVLDFDAERMRVIITDPFFAFFLRWRGSEAALQT